MLGPQEESACITAFLCNIPLKMYIQKEGSPTDFLDQCIMHSSLFKRMIPDHLRKD